MAHLIRIISTGNAAYPDPSLEAAIAAGEPIWLKSFDVEAHDGRGSAVFTDDPAEAQQFADLAAAFEAWKTQSRTRPLRQDGKPNRPLTAFSITFDVASDRG